VTSQSVTLQGGAGGMGEPNIFLPIVLVAFLLATGTCFSRLDPRRAALSAMLGGYLFIPEFIDRYSFLALNSKQTFVPAVVLLGSIAFDSRRWRHFRPRLLDVPMAVLCAGPFATALHNDLGAYEAVAATFSATMAWGAPYLLGRLYLGHPRALREFATALTIAALVYVPFCLWEVRMSPQLQYQLYGFRTENFTTVMRYGGYRPSVFMQTGLAVGMFIAMGTLCAAWLWRTGTLARLAGLPLGWGCALLAVTTVLCKSTGAIILLAVGVAVLEATRRLRIPILLLMLAAIPPVYCAARISGWRGETIIALARGLDEDRVNSVHFRIDNEQRLVEKAMMRPWLGWGRFGRSFIYNEEGQQESMVITDSLWIIALGFTGLLGLIALGAVLTVPPLLLLRTWPARHWADPRLAPAAVLATTLLLWAIDDLLNSMVAPVYPAISGALVSLLLIARASWTRLPRAAHRPLSNWASRQSYSR
jgi:hypothetical protein